MMSRPVSTRDQDQAIDALRERCCRYGGSAVRSMPRPDTLAAWIDSDRNQPTSRRRAHVSSCARCQSMISAGPRDAAVPQRRRGGGGDG